MGNLTVRTDHGQLRGRPLTAEFLFSLKIFSGGVSVKMETVISSCLLVFILGCNLSEAVKHEIVQERTYMSLHCPQSVVGEVTWSREKDGVRTDILTADSDRDIEHIHDPYKYYSSGADKSLLITKVRLTDSGRYFCNSEAAVDLTVVPEGTLILDAKERTDVTLNCSSDAGGSADPTWSTGSGEKNTRGRFYVSSADRTLKIKRVKPTDSGLYYCDGKAAAYLRVMGEDQSEGGKKTETTTTTQHETNREETERTTETVPIRPPPTDGDRTTTEETERTTTTQHTDNEKTKTTTTIQPETKREETERTTETVPIITPPTDGDTTTTEETKTKTTQHKDAKDTNNAPHLFHVPVRLGFVILYLTVLIGVLVFTWIKVGQMKKKRLSRKVSTESL